MNKVYIKPISETVRVRIKGSLLEGFNNDNSIAGSFEDTPVKEGFFEEEESNFWDLWDNGYDKKEEDE